MVVAAGCIGSSTSSGQALRFAQDDKLEFDSSDDDLILDDKLIRDDKFIFV